MAAHFKRLSLALVVASPFAVSLTAQTVEYPAGTTKYRVSTNAKGSQISPAGSQSFEISLREQITVDVMKHAKDTLMATMTVDSISLNSSAGPTPDVSTVRGAKFLSLMSPTGKVYSTQPPAGLDAAAAQVTEGIGRFLPAYRANLAKGATWADTTKGKINQQGLELDRTIISNYTVIGDTTLAGQRAFRVKRVTSTKATGSGDAQGTPITMETVGAGTAMYFISSKGAFMGATSTDDVNSTITVVGKNVKIGVTQAVQTTIDAIK
ncbi:MAG: hypothetical protein M3Z05_06170 [Gemmatimonadota bacterium]|nr:hypothetical protein [Gemmatimonadota bacterium]